MTTTAPPHTPTHPRLAPLAPELAFVRRSVLRSVRNTEALLMAVVLPVMLMLLFVYVFGGAIDRGGDYVDYVVPGIILLCAGFGASSTAVDVADDMQSGVMDRFRTIPIRSSAVLTGHVVASLLRNLLASAIVVGVALLVGFRPDAGLLEWLGTLGVVALWILAITYLFAAIGAAAPNAEAANGFGFILLFLPYLSSAFVPVETMPAWLRWPAEHQPITPVIETIRGLLMGTEVGTAPLLAVGWCALILAIALVWGGWVFRRKAARR